ncbi:MAG: valine--tRNA ligase [Candidatus Spyradocola sp.]|jgi:valyl-tRNA synthetase
MTEQMTNMPKTYDPTTVETRLYEKWESEGLFKPAEHKPEGAKPFCIVMPPPNITGQLHMGHAMDNTMPDILVRYHRMLGDDTLWLPGTDHASIATEVKILQAMAKEGLTKQDLGREGFLKRAWEWKAEYGGRIERQLRRLGSSCDWSRERFTMDEGCSKAVQEVFVRLYNEGLIYRGNRIINWCPNCKTALSDAEVEFEEQASNLWYIRYPAADGGEGVIVATTRPETMLGDTGVAVNPEDERYQNLIGKEVILPIRNRPIPVVGDEYVEKEFGTGAVKMTPAHDPNDFEVAQRHNLAVERVMNDDGTMNELCGKYAGMPALECRKAIVEDLKALGLLVKIEPYTHNVGTCYRCHHTVEPLVSTQWFVRMKPLAEPAIEAVRSGKTQFVPERFDKTYFNWMENIRDWCISRQLWWGHRIPAYYCTNKACGHMVVAKEAPTVCPHCGAPMVQDEDVLDTWFSSALWPFSTLGWPEKTEDLERFYPNTLLVTGYDIIFFWVARMIFSGCKQMGETPFAHVLIHGLVRDAQGRKMSKSLNNGIDPIQVIDKYGADALRFALIQGVAPGNDVRFSDEKVLAARNFANKVWNASRFALMNLDGPADDSLPKNIADKWILTRLNDAIHVVSEHLNDFDLAMAAQKLYDFIWSELCDWYLELAKAPLYGEDEKAASATRATLKYVLTNTLKLLHPFMPFVTEEIYSYLPDTKGSIMISSWPKETESFPAEAAAMQNIMDVIVAVRNLRAGMNVPPSKKAHLYIVPTAGLDGSVFAENETYFQRLASAVGVTVAAREDLPRNTVSAVCPCGEVFIPMGELVDAEKEIARLNKEIAAMEKEIARAEGKLNNPGFVNKAPAHVVEAERSKLATNRTMLEALRKSLEDMKNL